MTVVAQRDAALAEANRRRLARAGHRRTVRGQPNYDTAMLAVAGLLDRPLPELDGMFVIELLAWVRRSQPVTRMRLLQAAGISQTATVGSLTYRQRAALVAQLDADYGAAA
jgi:hypothetical protein